MKDLFAKCEEPGGYFSELRLQRDRYFVMPPLDSAPGHRMIFHGKPVVQWAVNNYLGLAERPELKEIAGETAAEWGLAAPMGSRFLTGNTTQHEELEHRLARFFAKPSAVIFNYGYLGVLGTVGSLVGKGDRIVIDELAHACMMDAAFAAGSFVPFRHNDLRSLELALRRASRDLQGGLLIMVEGVTE
jgi:glycine C-acetyltransferase